VLAYPSLSSFVQKQTFLRSIDRGSQNYAGSTLIAINAGLMKPRKGFTPVGQ